jgi:hypothetical protein
MDSLKLEFITNSDFNCWEFRFSKKGEEVFQATKYQKSGYSTVNWIARLDKSKEEHYKSLLTFYDNLRNGSFQEIKDRGLERGIEFINNRNPNRKFPLSELESVPKYYERFKDFKLLRIDTDYAALTMEDGLNNHPWQPGTGRITVTAAQDISVPLSDLIRQTGRKDLDHSELMLAFAPIYKF